jgi:hypothetical protein
MSELTDIEFTGYLSDLWKFNLSYSTWLPIESHGATPGRRYGHSLVAIKSNLYVFGGDSDLGNHSNVNLIVMMIFLTLCCSFYRCYVQGGIFERHMGFQFLVIGMVQAARQRAQPGS